MKITESTYKNIFALRIEGEKFIAVILPDEGAKIASFVDKANGKEYLVQNPHETYLSLGKDGNFESCECSGFDDMFPTIDPCTVDGRDDPDHGEVSRVRFSHEVRKECLFLSYFSPKGGYSYQKTLTEDKEGRLCITYKIKNETALPLRALFAAHCLVRIENGGRVIAPFASGEDIDLVYDTEVKEARLRYRPDLLATVWGEKREARKFYFVGKCREGAVSYEYPSGERFVLGFDREKLPYLGIWMDFGRINGTYSVGLEPCSLGYDTVIEAERRGQTGEIRDTLEFSLYLSVT